MDNKQFDYLDLITILSFAIGLEALEIAKKNLEENRQQTDDTQKILKELEYHLAQQDEILEKQSANNVNINLIENTNTKIVTYLPP